MADRQFTDEELSYPFNSDEFAKGMRSENKMFIGVFAIVGIILLGIALFLNSPGHKESVAQEKAAQEQARIEKEEKAARIQERNDKIRTTEDTNRAGVFPHEFTGTGLDDLTYAMRNTSYRILTAVDNGTVKAGDTLESVKSKVPDAFTASTGVNMNVSWNPAKPKMFAICGTLDGTDYENLSNSILYSAGANGFKGGTFDCINVQSTAVSAAFLPVALTQPEINDPATIPANFVFGSAEEAAQAPLVDPTQSTPVTPDTTSTTAKAPAEIPWGIIIILMLVIVGLGTVSFIGFKVHSLSGKARENARLRDINLREWNALINRYDTVAKEWASYELDPVRILDFPLMSDMREGRTERFHDALRKAKYLKSGDLKELSFQPAGGSAFAAAVDELEKAFNLAEAEAKRVRWNKFSDGERKRLQRAKNLLNLAMDGGATDSERQAAYKRMQRELEGLIVIPKAIVLAIEKKISLSLTDGRTATPVQ